MMVKNEEKIIQRAISSAIEYVDGIVLVDTGSTDNTKELAAAIAREHNKPIYIHDDRWEDFGTNRTRAFKFAKSVVGNDVFLLLLDADDKIIDLPDCSSIPDYVDAVTAMNKFGPKAYRQIRLIKTSADFDFEWIGKTHEYLSSNKEGGIEVDHLFGFVYELGTDSNRRLSGNKTFEDIELLRQTLKEDPENPRAWFYLGNCYWDQRTTESLYKAVNAYLHRASLIGYKEEIYLSWIRAGICCWMLGKHDDAILSWLSAIDADKNRREAYTLLAELYLSVGKKNLAFLFSEHGIAAAPPEGQLFADTTCEQRCWDVFNKIYCPEQKAESATEETSDAT